MREANAAGQTRDLTAILVQFVAPVLASLALAFGGLRFGLPALDHWKHERCLTRIALLEIDLGIRSAPAARLLSPAAAAERWTQAAKGAASNYMTVTPIPYRSYAAAIDDDQRTANKAARLALAEYVAGRRHDALPTAADRRRARRQLYGDNT